MERSRGLVRAGCLGSPLTWVTVEVGRVDWGSCFCMLAVRIPIFFTLSYRVREGTPYFLLACRADIPFLTSSIAARISSFVYCLYRFHSTLPLGPIVLTIPGAGGVSSLR